MFLKMFQKLILYSENVFLLSIYAASLCIYGSWYFFEYGSP
uniref:Uncharacterized protein n=1 Tax=Anguilla anguilla TaxID=7936 RepID=A0A0E9QMZ4_ANGAN